MLKKLSTILTLIAFSPLPLAAQNMIPAPITGEILTGWQRGDGTRVAAIKLTLKPGWKTYWRSPGDAGIPPEFNWSKSSNLGGIGITWPTPQVFPQNGMQTIVYKDEVILPLTIAPRRAGAPVNLRVNLDIGVCDDICIPFQMDLAATLSNTNTKPVPAIAAALAARPYSAKDAGVSAATCALRPNAKGLEITAQLTMPSTGGREVVIIEPNQANLWMSETKIRRNGRALTATGDLIASGGGPIALDRSAITITVLGEKQAVEINGCTPG